MLDSLLVFLKEFYTTLFLTHVFAQDVGRLSWAVVPREWLEVD
jgi:hypothetical protein